MPVMVSSGDTSSPFSKFHPKASNNGRMNTCLVFSSFCALISAPDNFSYRSPSSSIFFLACSLSINLRTLYVILRLINQKNDEPDHRGYSADNPEPHDDF